MGSIKDQRSLYVTARPLVTPDDVQRFWQQYATSNPVPFTRNGETVRTLEETRQTVEAHIEHGRWIALCAADDCFGGIACWPDNPKAACLSCGRVYRAVFPPAEAREAAEALLAERAEWNQHWRPHEGEGLTELRLENLTHGLSTRGPRPLWRDVAELHGVEEPVAKKLLKTIEQTGNSLLLPGSL